MEWLAKTIMEGNPSNVQLMLMKPFTSTHVIPAYF